MNPLPKKKTCTKVYPKHFRFHQVFKASIKRTCKCPTTKTMDIMTFNKALTTSKCQFTNMYHSMLTMPKDGQVKSNVHFIGMYCSMLMMLKDGEVNVLTYTRVQASRSKGKNNSSAFNYFTSFFKHIKKCSQIAINPVQNKFTYETLM